MINTVMNTVINTVINVINTMVNARVIHMVTGRSKPRANAKKSVPPSRARYEEANPAVTVRISQELREKLGELKEKQGLSVGDVLRIGLEMATPDLNVAHERGTKEGYEVARREYEVKYRCGRCGRRHLSITEVTEKKAAASLMEQAGWYSPDCR